MLDWLADKYWRWYYRRSRARAWERGPRAHGVFPAYSDWGGGIAVDRRGEVWYSEQPSSWTNPAVVEDPAIRFAALGIAVGRHPELADVRPIRHANDPMCPTCRGRGYPAQLPPRLRYFVVCQCGGLGWVPAQLADHARTSLADIDAPAS